MPFYIKFNMLLSTVNKNQSGYIKEINGVTSEQLFRLKTLGFLPNEKFLVLKKNKRCLIVDVNNRKVALSIDIARRILVYE